MCRLFLTKKDLAKLTLYVWPLLTSLFFEKSSPPIATPSHMLKDVFEAKSKQIEHIGIPAVNGFNDFNFDIS